MQDYKKDFIELHDLTSEDVSEIDDITDHWEDLHIYDSYDDAIYEIVHEYLSCCNIEKPQVDAIMQFLGVRGFADYNGLSFDLYELSSGKTVQSF